MTDYHEVTWPVPNGPTSCHALVHLLRSLLIVIYKITRLKCSNNKQARVDKWYLLAEGTRMATCAFARPTIPRLGKRSICFSFLLGGRPF